MITTKCFVFRFSDVEVHEDELKVTRGGQRLEIEPKAFRVLVYLVQHAGHLVSKSELMDAVWGETAVTENSLTRAIALLRRVLEDDPHQPHFIETVSTAGYRFICPVESQGPPEASGISCVQRVKTLEASTSVIDRETRTSFVRRWRWALATSAAGAAVATAAFLWYIHQPLPPPRVSEIRQLTRDVRFLYKRPLGAGGGRVYFSGSPRGLYAVGSSGDVETIPLIVPWSSDLPVWAWDVSPDGQYFLAWPMDNRPTAAVWVFTTAGKPVRYLVDALWWSPHWSPDGQQVIYQTGDGKVYTISSAGGDPRVLFTPSPSIGTDLSWSPDGKRIRYISAGHIWEIASDGTNRREILPTMKDSASKCCGRWTPDDAYYIFASANKLPRHYLEAGQLWALAEHSGKLQKPNYEEPVQLTSGAMQWSFLVISADSRTIYATGTLRQGELISFDTKTGQSVRYLGGISADWLTFSPDGKYVAYVSYPERKVWRANRDGSGSILLAEPEHGASHIRWSPDGTRILFVTSANPLADEAEIYTITPQGGKPERVQLPQGENPVDPTWSPDSKRLAYTIDHFPNVTPNGIRILDLETHRSTTLPTAPVPLFGPRWSPDGRYIFCSAESRNSSVGIAWFDTEKQTWTYLPTKIDWTFGNWAHDSRSVYVLGAKVPLSFDGVYRVSVPSGKTERVIDLANVRLAGSTIGYWLGLDPEDHPLILRDAGSVELYALTLERK